MLVCYGAAAVCLPLPISEVLWIRGVGTCTGAAVRGHRGTGLAGGAGTGLAGGVGAGWADKNIGAVGSHNSPPVAHMMLEIVWHGGKCVYGERVWEKSQCLWGAEAGGVWESSCSSETPFHVKLGC